MFNNKLNVVTVEQLTKSEPSDDSLIECTINYTGWGQVREKSETSCENLPKGSINASNQDQVFVQWCRYQLLWPIIHCDQ